MAWAAREKRCLPSSPQATLFLPEQVPGGPQLCPPPSAARHARQESLEEEKHRTYGLGGGTEKPPIRGEEPELLALASPQQLAQAHHTYPSTQKQDEK